MVYISNKDLKDQSMKTDNSLKVVYAFSNRIFKSGIITQARKNRFHAKKETKKKRRDRALYKNKLHDQLVQDFKAGKVEPYSPVYTKRQF
jgi:hypothetical protein